MTIVNICVLVSVLSRVSRLSQLNAANLTSVGILLGIRFYSENLCCKVDCMVWV